MDKNLYIDELVIYVNGELERGLSTAQIEKNMNAGKDTIRKKLNRYNYKYDKDNKQYVFCTNTKVTPSNKEKITSTNTKVTQANNTNKTYCGITHESGNTSATEQVITQSSSDITQVEIKLTEEEIIVLKKLATNYIDKVPSKYDGEIVTRSFRTYKSAIEDFVRYCSANNLSQKESVAIAFDDFIKKER